MNPKLMVFVLVVVVLAGIAAYFMMQGGDDSPAGTAEEGPAPAVDEEEDTENTNPREAAGGEGEEKAPVQEEEAVVEKKVSENEPQAKNPAKDISGCTFHGTAESYDAKKRVWKDLSAAKNDVARVEGEIEVDSDDSSNNQKFLFGSTDTFMEFPQAVMTTGRKYTLFHVARYNGSTKGRIFAGTNNAFVSGFTNGFTGTAHDTVKDGSPTGMTKRPSVSASTPIKSTCYAETVYAARGWVYQRAHSVQARDQSPQLTERLGYRRGYCVQ